MSIHNSEYDKIDHMIADCIMQDASLTSAGLGEKVGLSASAANERLRRLKQNGGEQFYAKTRRRYIVIVFGI